MKDFEGVGGGLAAPLEIVDKQVRAALAHGWGYSEGNRNATGWGSGIGAGCGDGDGSGYGDGDDGCIGEG